MNTMNSMNTMHTTNTTSNGVMPCRDVFDSRHFANPFSTRFTRPGKIEPRDCSGQPLAILQLLKQLHDCGGTAAIQGPHGSGKTTLLVHIAGELQQRGGLAASLRLRSWRDAPAVFFAIARSRPGSTVCLDSWEKIGCIAGWLVRMAARIFQCGLLVTSHRRTGLPVLVESATTRELLASIVCQLPDHSRWSSSLIKESDIEEAFSKCGGNVRESLYELYDRFEHRRPLL